MLKNATKPMAPAMGFVVSCISVIMNNIGVFNEFS